jgi:hypothetical protein
LCQEAFQESFPNDTLLNKTIYSIITKFEENDSVCDRKHNSRRTGLNDDTVEDVSLSLLQSPSKSFCSPVFEISARSSFRWISSMAFIQSVQAKALISCMLNICCISMRWSRLQAQRLRGTHNYIRRLHTSFHSCVIFFHMALQPILEPCPLY